MSFKRETDNDASYLDQLKNSRVRELLAEHIPEDEALLLKNGRYACLVCSHRPVCDTLPMLSRHRIGKKHLYCLAKFMERKQEVELLILKRQQETYLKTGQTSNPGATALPNNNQSHGQESSLFNKYSTHTRAKRPSRRTPYSRKETINIKRSEGCSIQQEMISKHTSSVEDEVTRYVKKILQKNEFSDAVMKERRLCHLPQSKIETPITMNSVNLTANSLGEDKLPVASDLASQEKVVISPSSQFKLERCKYYQNLRASGWKRDLLGNWTRDAEAEFDSDEEPPQEFKGQFQ
ncbi:hypothetical protein OTU49_001697 [Cherax quadricarinatus]|uniref:Sodium channel modifier 1 n=1 Tax=Cherax quadricarinatus TaxID=27406 RepID=A0AAW0XS99_CHEQU